MYTFFIDVGDSEATAISILADNDEGALRYARELLKLMPTVTAIKIYPFRPTGQAAYTIKP